jgi:hypothetical protein
MLNQDFKEFIQLLNNNQVKYRDSQNFGNNKVIDWGAQYGLKLLLPARSIPDNLRTRRQRGGISLQQPPGQLLLYPFCPRTNGLLAL